MGSSIIFPILLYNSYAKVIIPRPTLITKLTIRVTVEVRLRLLGYFTTTIKLAMLLGNSPQPPAKTLLVLLSNSEPVHHVRASSKHQQKQFTTHPMMAVDGKCVYIHSKRSVEFSLFILDSNFPSSHPHYSPHS